MLQTRLDIGEDDVDGEGDVALVVLVGHQGSFGEGKGRSWDRGRRKQLERR